MLLLGLLAAAACGGARSGPTPVADSTYVAVMGELLRLDRTRRTSPMPVRPMPPTNGTAKDSAKADSALAAWRADSLAREVADSAARAAVLVRYGVTLETLEATARVLAGDTKRGRTMWERIQQRSSETPADSAAPDTGAVDTGDAVLPVPDGTVPAPVVTGAPPKTKLAPRPRKVVE